MMMAEEPNQAPGVLSDDGISTIRQALQQYAAEPDQGEELRRALRLVSAEARQKAILPEQLLTTLKDIWYELPNTRVVPGSDHVRLLQRVVTICIKEYYSL